MKDSLGHGSNAHGGLTPVQQENAPFKSRLGKQAGHSYLDPRDPRGAHTAGVQAIPGRMTRAHFEQVAASLKNAPDAGSPEHSQRVSEMADRLSTTNPGFRRDLFVKASTPGGGYKDRSRATSKANAARKVAKVLR